MHVSIGFVDQDDRSFVEQQRPVRGQHLQEPAGGGAEIVRFAVGAVAVDGDHIRAGARREQLVAKNSCTMLCNLSHLELSRLT